MYKILIFVTLLTLNAFAQQSNTNKNVKMSCGTCSNKVGCPGNKCLKVTGDFQDEACYGSSTCDFASQASMSMGLCSRDYSGANCPSGMCAESATVNSCVNMGTQCPSGTTFLGICNGNSLTMRVNGQSTVVNADCEFK